MTETTRSATRTANTRSSFGALLAIFLLGMGLRFYGLDATSLWGDELYTATKAHPDLLSVFETMASTGDNPPLSFAIIGSLVGLLGNSDFVYRLASALLGSLSVLLTYSVGQQLWTRKVGLIGSFLLAVSPFHIQYSQFARHYAITVFLVLLSAVFLLKALESGGRSHWLGFAVAAALSVYNQYFAILALGVLAIHGICVIASSALARAKPRECANGTQHSRHLPGPGKQALWLVCSLGLIALLFAPWWPAMQGHVQGPLGWTGFRGAALLHNHELSGYLREWLNECAGTEGALPLAFLGLFVLGLAHSERRHALFAALWVGVPLLFSLTVASSKLAAPRYSVFVLPIYLLAVAQGALWVASVVQRGFSRFIWKRKDEGLSAALLVLLAFAALSVAPLRAYYLKGWQDDWHAVSRYLADNLLPGDTILADGVGYSGIRDSSRVAMALSHYLPIYGMTDTPIVEVERGLFRQLTALAQRDGRLWIVVYYPRSVLSLQNTQYHNTAYFQGVLVIRPSEPSGDVLEDAPSALHELLDLMPTGESRFDVHLALADIYLAMWQLEDAHAQVQEAALVQPDKLGALMSLRQTRLRLERESAVMAQVLYPTWCDFGEVVALVGYDITTQGVAPDHTLDLTLWWETTAKMNNDYTAFIHLVDPQGRILVQEDRLLLQGELPTSGWRVGDIVKEQYRLRLGPDTAPFDYLIKVGVYYWQTGERLPVWDEQGRRLPDDTIVLKTTGEGH